MGLTDKETMHVILRESREERRDLNRIRDLAAKGLRSPDQLSADEVRELCDTVLRRVQPREARSWPG